MLAFIQPPTQILAAALLLGAAAAAQSTDITGWNGLPWGTPKPAALLALRSHHVRECPSCSGADALVIENYSADYSANASPRGLAFRVQLLFLPKSGLASVTMTADDSRESFQKVLSALTARYGRPGLRSEYDGDREVTRTKWEWSKPHGKLSLSSSDEDGSGGLFTIVYEARRIP